MIPYDMGLVYSSNVVTSSIIANLIDPSVYEHYLSKFGFFTPVESYGISEVNGVKNYKWAADKLAMTYGQGSTVTMLQILQGFSSIFSDGTMVKPYYIEQIRSSYDTQEILYQAETEVVGNPIRPDTAAKVQELMYRTANTEEGTAKHYRIDETENIAKTGTAQISKSGSYQSGKTISSVMIGLPAEDPKYMIYYAFEADYDRNAHFYTDPIKQLTRKVAQTYSLTSGIDNAIGSTIQKVEIKDEIMPSLINHSSDYSQKKLEELKLTVIELGTGSTIIAQYPEAGNPVVTGQRVFLLKDTGSMLMPDMNGWTRKELTGFWSITQIGIRMNGFGTVVTQNISPGTSITQETEIEVTLE